MADYSNMFKKSVEYLKASEIAGQTIPARIISIQTTNFGDDEKLMLGVNTANGQTGVILNKTNFENMVSYFGPESDNWIGKALTITTHKTTFKGRTYDSLLLLNHPENTAAAAAQVSPAQAMVEPNPDIPF